MSIAKVTATKRRRTVAKKKELLPRQRLAAIRERSRLSVREVVSRLGYQSPAGYHRYEREDLQKDQPIPLDIVRRLMPHFLGRGQPPITADEMMALTDVQESFSRGVVDKYFTTPAAVAEGSGLVMRYAIEPGKFVKADAVPEASSARSMVCAHSLYGGQTQFVVVVRGAVGGWYSKGDQLHCIDPSEFSPRSMRGRRVVVSAPYKGGDLVEVVVAEVQTDDALICCVDGARVAGTVLGVVIGVYRTE